jgi:hypothetical protein
MIHFTEIATADLRKGDILLEAGVHYLSFDLVTEVTTTEDHMAVTSHAFTLWADGTSNPELFLTTWQYSEDQVHQVVRF